MSEYESDVRRTLNQASGFQPHATLLLEALVLETLVLWELADLGYAYAIIGAAGPVEFYAKAVGATVIPDSSPGVYADLLW